MGDYEAFQRRLSTVALSAVGRYGFALAGSGAVREHGLIDRPTDDVDLFTTYDEIPFFPIALDALTEAFEADGLSVDVSRRSESFACLEVCGDGLTASVDMGVDYRAWPAVRLDVGPVLDRRDAIANKVGAAYGRGGLRDLLDLQSIRDNSGLSDDELLSLARENDPGIDPVLFSESLRLIDAYGPDDSARYGVSADEFRRVKNELLAWSDEISEASTLGGEGLRAASRRVVDDAAGAFSRSLGAASPGPHTPAESFGRSL